MSVKGGGELVRPGDGARLQDATVVGDKKHGH